MNRVQKIGNCDFENNYKTLIPKLNISKSMMIDVFEDKKGVKLSDTLKSLPAQNLYVLDCICNLFDSEGEEKQLSYEKLMSEIR